MKRSQLREIIREELANRPVQQVKEDLSTVLAAVGASIPALALAIQMATDMYNSAKDDTTKSKAQKLLNALQKTASVIASKR